MCVPLKKGILCHCLRNEVTLYILMEGKTIYGTKWSGGAEHTCMRVYSHKVKSLHHIDSGDSGEWV